MFNHKKWRKENPEYLKQWRKENPEKVKEYQKQQKKWRKENPEYDKKWQKENPEYHKEYNKQWRKENPEYNKKQQRKWHKEHPECNKRWHQENPEWQKQYQKQRRQIDPKYRLDCNMSCLISISLKGKKAGRKWKSLVGYTLENLIAHLEKQFDDKMTWQNYGSYWWIDHIKARSLFKYETAEDLEFKQCWVLENLQPLEKIANIKKSNHY